MELPILSFSIVQLKCFICRHDLVQNNFGSFDSQYSLKSLRHLLRFVGLREKVFLEKGTLDKLVCSQCVLLLEKFQQLYAILEETRLRLQQSVQDITVVMKEADEHITISDLLSSVARSDEDVLRRELSKQCHRMLNSSQPRIVLDRFKLATVTAAPANIIKTENPCKNEVDLDDLPNGESDADPFLSNSNHLSISDHLDMDIDLGEVKAEPKPVSEISNAIEVKHEFNTEPSSVSAPAPAPARYRIRNKQDFTHCPYCSKFCSPKYLDKHYTFKHPENYLFKHRLDAVTLPQYKDIVNKFLLPDLLRPGVCTECGRSWKDKSTCPEDARRKLQRHWLVTHGLFVKKKLAQLQTDPEVLAESLSCRCDLCGRKLASRAYLSRHKMRFCKKGEDRQKFRKECDGCHKLMYVNTLAKHLKYGWCKGLSSKKDDMEADPLGDA